MKKICIIYNSKISLFNKFLLNRIIKILKKENQVETFGTERIGHATLLCKVHIKKFDIMRTFTTHKDLLSANQNIWLADI